MIHFTIKTLDSADHQFSLDEETTVQELKERVREELGIEIGLQRLIFCGRVLQDDKKLSDYAINGKVVHLVQRAPPIPEQRQSAPSSSTTAGPSNSNPQIRHFMAMAPGLLPEDPHLGITQRMEVIQQLINDIKQSLNELRIITPEQELAATVVENPTPAPRSANEENAAPPSYEELEESATLFQQNPLSGAMQAMGGVHPRQLGRIYAELESLMDQFNPYRLNFMRLLNSSTYSRALFNRSGRRRSSSMLSERDRWYFQRTSDLVNDLMHSFGHVYHALSDISFHMGLAPLFSRLTADSPPRLPLPLQAHINLVQSNRRNPRNNAAASRSNPSATQTSASAGAAAGEASAQEQADAGAAQAPNASRPDPTNYQAEMAIEDNIYSAIVTAGLETNRNYPPGFVPNAAHRAAVPLSAFPSNDAAAATNGPADTAAPAPPPPAAADAQIPSAPPLPPQNDQQNNQQNQGPGVRRQVLLDFDNIFGPGGHSHGNNVEVVMSMEELPQSMFGPLTGASGNFGFIQNPPNMGESLNILSNAGPGADMLQNIVTSVIRQGLIQGVGEVAIHLPNMPGQNQAQNNQGQNAQGQSGESQSHQGQPARGQTNQDQSASGEPGQAQENRENNNQDQPGQPRQPIFQMPRATTRAVALSGLVYDRFLRCDNIHSRRRLQQRRDLLQQQLAAQRRDREDTAATTAAAATVAQSLEFIREVNPGIRQNYLNTILQLLNGPSSPATWLNALIVALSRQMSPIYPTPPGQPPFVPSEFYRVRELLKDFMQNLMSRSSTERPNNTSFEALGDFLVDQYEYFIDRMPHHVAMRTEVNASASIRALMHARFPAVVTAILMVYVTNSSVATYYQLIANLFADLSTLIWYMCIGGITGFRIIFNEFIEYILDEINGESGGVVRILAIENFNHLVLNMDFERRFRSLRTFIRRVGDPPDSDIVSDNDNASSSDAMEVPRQHPPQSSQQNPRQSPQQTPRQSPQHSSRQSPPCHDVGLLLTDCEDELSEDEDYDENKDEDCNEYVDVDNEQDDEEDDGEDDGQADWEDDGQADWEDDGQADGEDDGEADGEDAVEDDGDEDYEDIDDDDSDFEDYPVLTRINLLTQRRAFWKFTTKRGRRKQRCQCSQRSSTFEQRARAPDAPITTAANVRPTNTVTHSTTSVAASNASTVEAMDTTSPSTALVEVPTRDVGMELASTAPDSAPAVVAAPAVAAPLATSSAASVQSVETPPRASTSSAASATTTASSTTVSEPTNSPNGTADDGPGGRVTIGEFQVAPKVIAQHWGEQWVPVFARDERAQRPSSPEPYSDSYLSGMPSRKRRRLRQNRPPTNLNDLLHESLAEAAGEAARAQAARGDELGAVRGYLREHVRALVAVRAALSRDFDPAHHRSAAALLPQNSRAPSVLPQQEDDAANLKDDA